jgi:hypothetical protein
MTGHLVRYYDRYAFIAGESGGSGFSSLAGRYGARRGKLCYHQKMEDNQDFSRRPPTSQINTIGLNHKNPVIVVPVTKVKPMISSY